MKEAALPVSTLGLWTEDKMEEGDEESGALTARWGSYSGNTTFENLLNKTFKLSPL